jgi:AraC-like DNA-binding protein
MQTARSGASPQAQRNQWFRTRSPEQAIHLCEAAYYPHRLRLLGPSKSFGLTQRVTSVGPMTVGEITYETDVAMRFDEGRASYHVCVPLEGRLEARHRGQQVTSTPTLASVYRPDADIAMETLVGRRADFPIAFDAALPLKTSAVQDWVRLLLMVSRQRERPDSLLRHPLVWDPLLESLIHGFLLVADHPDRDALDAPAEPAGPTAVRDAMGIIETCPQMPLTTATLAMQCHISVRTLQEGFRRHLGISPMAYLRTIRLRHAHRDLRTAYPTHVTVASIAHRWGFTHLGRFAAAHKAMFGETPLQVLHSAR